MNIYYYWDLIVISKTLRAVRALVLECYGHLKWTWDTNNNDIMKKREYFWMNLWLFFTPRLVPSIIDGNRVTSTALSISAPLTPPLSFPQTCWDFSNPSVSTLPTKSRAFVVFLKLAYFCHVCLIFARSNCFWVKNNGARFLLDRVLWMYWEKESFICHLQKLKNSLLNKRSILLHPLHFGFTECQFQSVKVFN